MRHKKGYKKIGKDTPQRRAMLRNMSTDMVEHEALTTTLARAKALKPVVEKLVTLGKKGGLDRIRKAGSYLFRKDATKKLFDEIGPRYADRPGGYTRILKLGTRVSDGAQMAQIEFVKNAAAKK